jgi:hypothetical protein
MANPTLRHRASRTDDAVPATDWMNSGRYCGLGSNGVGAVGVIPFNANTGKKGLGGTPLKPSAADGKSIYNGKSVD